MSRPVYYSAVVGVHILLDKISTYNLLCLENKTKCIIFLYDVSLRLGHSVLQSLNF